MILALIKNKKKQGRREQQLPIGGERFTYGSTELPAGRKKERQQPQFM